MTKFVILPLRISQVYLAIYVRTLLMTLSFSRSIHRVFFAEPVSCVNSMPFEESSNDSSYYGENNYVFLH